MTKSQSLAHSYLQWVVPGVGLVWLKALATSFHAAASECAFECVPITLLEITTSPPLKMIKRCYFCRIGANAELLLPDSWITPAIHSLQFHNK